MIIRKVNMSQLYHYRQIDKLIDQFNDLYSRKGNIYFFEYYPYLRALIYVGELDKAEQIIKKIYDDYKEPKCGALFNLLLSEIYYYKKEFCKSLYYYDAYMKFDGVQYDKKFLKSIMRGILYDTNPELGNGNMYRRLESLRRHVLYLRDRSFTITWEVFIKTIRENFDKAPTFYHDFAYEKVFRCQNISFCNDAESETDFFRVVYLDSGERAVDSIVTIIPLDYHGDCGYYDLTHELYNSDIKNTKVSKESQEQKQRRLDKFNKRQEKKVN